MSRYFVSLCLQRLLLPIALLTGCVLRQNGLSFVYLLLLLYNPIVPVAAPNNIVGHAGRYLKIVIFFTIVNAVAQFAFQILLLSYPPYGSIVSPACGAMERYLRYAGLIRLDNLNIWDAMRVLSPEVIMLATAIVVLILCRAINRSPSDTERLLPVVSTPPSDAEKVTERQTFSILTVLGKYVVLASLCFAGILRPSGLNGVYFFLFLITMTYWAYNKDLGRGFAITCRVVLVLVMGHIITLYLYQMQWAQELLPGDDPVARYLGLTPLQITNCTDPRVAHLTNAEWASYVNPLALVWLYFMLWYTSNVLMTVPDTKGKDEGMTRQLSARLSQRRLLRNQTNRWRSATRKVRVRNPSILPLPKNTTLSQDQVKQIKDPAPHTELSETTPLIRGRESVYRHSTKNVGALFQDSHGSVTISDVPEESIKLENVPEEVVAVTENEEAKSSILEIVLNAVVAVAQMVAQSSYIVTNIIMMAWSITYHSWLTFVLLLWASIMWMLPNQRRAMLRSSPFLVLYSEFLLIAQYLYGMNLTDDELPQTVQGLNLKQIGFEKCLHLPVRPLLIKTLYTLMFWITMRQYNQERWEARNSSTLADMVAPLQIGVGAATTAMGGETQTKTNQLVQKTGRLMRSLMTKYWIWVVASILLAIGIAGERMTIFRIVYMALALVFILTFQLSWVIWRKMMYGFWLTVIMYSMLILVLTYTYQFDNFPEYWEKYIGIPVDLQMDIGLERFETTELFVRLLTPTFFVIITVIQLYYFHKDFLAISDITSRGTSSVRPSDGGSSIPKSEQSIPMSPTDTVPHEDGVSTTSKQEPKKSFHLLAGLSRLRLHLVGHKIMDLLARFIEFLWLFLELHMLKIVMLSIMMLAVYDVCALHFVFVLISVVALTFGSSIQKAAAHIMSIFVSILILSKMIYQIEYIKHETWNVTCPQNESYNTAEWIGFHKTSNLPLLLKGYIVIIFVMTVHTVVTVRQKYQRHLRGRPLSRPIVMFPRVTYKEADKDIEHCVKYLLNYGFYRFGVEICLMAIVALIGMRMDMYALIYALWMVLLITPRRYLLSKVWGVFMVFIVITIPLQYAVVVGFPPTFCFEYPWEQSEILRSLQEWMFLPDPVRPPPAYKLMCDFIVLILVCRQALVFRIEERHSGHEYAGGTNKSIVEDVEKPGFVNPVPDFVSSIRSWLDVFKKIVLSGFIWFTLAVVFLAGTNRVNLFSLGYLIGSFIFLWQGNDLYLRPLRVILRWWNHLIDYSVSVIVIKAGLQILGCVFLKEMQLNACWAVQLLGIACIQKFGATVPKGESDCSVPPGDVGLAWDGFCFGFLILQRRLFNSHYFLHIVDEAKAMAILSSRGAELIEELSQKQIQEQQETERKILEKIKYKMDRIKASQQKIQGPSYKEPITHYVGLLRSGSQQEQAVVRRRNRPSSSRSAIRSGDYYMFDDIDDELDLIQEQESETSGDTDEKDRDGRGITVGQFLSSAMKTDMEKATQLAKERERSPHSRQTSGGETSEDMSPRGSSPQQTDEPTWRSCSSLPEAENDESDRDYCSLTYKRPPSKHKYYDSDNTDYDELIGPTKKSLPVEDGPESPAKQSSTINAVKHYSVTFRSLETIPSSDGETGRQPQPGTSSGAIGGFPPSQSPRPGTSGEGVKSRTSESSDEDDEDDSVIGKIVTFLKFVGAFINSVMVTLTRYLNKFSRDYRYVMRTLAIEKKQLKEKTGFGQGFRTGTSMVWQPLPFTLTSKPKTSSDSTDGQVESVSPVTERSYIEKERLHVAVPVIRILAPSLERGLDSDSSPLQIEEMEQERELSAADQPPIVRLCLAVWYAIISHTELVCYFTIFLHQIKSATLLSLPLPLMVFLWGTLTIPRPSKTFWVTIIAYTEVIVVIKCMFQFELLPWNQYRIPENAPFDPPRIIGIERKPMYAMYDLLVLLIVFFHRSMLKSLGLWKTTRDVKKVEFAVNTDNHESTETVDVGESSEKSATMEMRTESTIVNNCEYFPAIIPMSANKYLSPIKGFYVSLLEPSVRVTADMYAYMFFCDFFNFLVVIFGFAAFGSQQGDGGVSQYFEENKVPIAFLVMLILQFALIIVDRTLYLRKFILGKIIFQFVLVIGVHAWMFFVLPAVTERQFNAALPPQMWYMVKCFYLLLSAYQIRSGYPTRILGNFLCKSFNYLNMFLFKIFMVVPFVFELRALMDWIWTDTSMTLSDWLKMEDIFAHVFQLKCQRRAETEYPLPRGEKKSSISKYLVGGGCLISIIALIWFPLVLFALGNTVGQANLPYDVTLNVRINAYQPIYTMSAQNNSIFKINSEQWQFMSGLYKKSRAAQTFLSNYEYDDMGTVQLSSHSTSIWTISPPDEENMKKEAESTNPITVKLTWSIFRRSDSPEQPGSVTGSQEATLTANNPERIRLVQMLLNSSASTEPIVVTNVLPKFMKVTSRGTATPVSQLMVIDDSSGEEVNPFRNITMRLRHDTQDRLFWWEIKEDCRDETTKVLSKLPYASCDNLIMYTFNDKAFPATLTLISGKGIIGLYTTFVIVVHSFIRGFFTGISFKIMFDDMPNVDRVLQLCLDIYLVRESGELDLEEDLFAKLVFLYRSPETLIKWTRPPEEVPPDEAEDLPQLAS